MVLSACVTAAPQGDRPVNLPLDAVKVHGKAVVRDAHCGGALATGPDASPAANLTLRLQLGEQNLAAPPAAIIQTDASGGFDAWLSPGEYCVVLKSRSREGGRMPAVPEWAGAAPLTPECLEKLALLCDGQLVVNGTQHEVVADLIGKRCPATSPCAAEAPKPAGVP